MNRRLFFAGIVLGLVLALAAPAGAQVGTPTTRPPNGDEVATALAGTTGPLVAVMVFGAGVAALSVLLLQRYLHAAVQAA